MPAIQHNKLQLLYNGSVKRVYSAPDATTQEKLWFEFSDDYSVFDWGKMPDTIANKGRALTLMGAYFFEELAKKGIKSHFYRLVDSNANEVPLASAASRLNDALYMEVARAEVLKPEPAVVLGNPVYFYPQVPANVKRRLVPLEVVFRFGMPAGSSLKERLERNPEYAAQLGLPSTGIEPNKMFSHPVFEFFTKLEPKDRLLTVSEAVNISGLNAKQFNELCDLAKLTAQTLFDLFASGGIELWDGKFEFILDGDRVLLADSIGPDELRLIYRGVHLSKEMIRQVYRGTPWETALKNAQKLAAQRGSEEWKAICIDELHAQPEKLPAPFKKNIDELYGALANHITGLQLFPNQPTLDNFADAINKGAKQ